MTPEPDPVPSPCVRMCTLNEDDVCLGCGRNIREICDWRAYSEEERRQASARAAARRQEFEHRFGRY